MYMNVWTLRMFANQRGGALQVGFQTRLAKWPEPQNNDTKNIIPKKSPDLITKEVCSED